MDALGQLNFLSDKATQAYMATTDFVLRSVWPEHGKQKGRASGRQRRVGM